MVVMLIAMIVKGSSPVGPLNKTARNGTVENLAPSIVGSKRGLRSSQAAINAVFTAGQQGDARKFMLKRKIIDNEAVKLKAPSQPCQ